MVTSCRICVRFDGNVGDVKSLFGGAGMQGGARSSMSLWYYRIQFPTLGPLGGCQGWGVLCEAPGTEMGTIQPDNQGCGWDILISPQSPFSWLHHNLSLSAQPPGIECLRACVLSLVIFQRGPSVHSQWSVLASSSEE